MTTDDYAKLLGADVARISEAGGRKFLIIGNRRNTRDDANGVWMKDGKPWHFDYVKETVVASGRTDEELEASARMYKLVKEMTWDEYFEEALLA